MFYIALLESRRFIVINRGDWIKDRRFGKKSLIFFSPDLNDEVNFNAPKKFLFDAKSPAVYNGFFKACFGEYWTKPFCPTIDLDIKNIHQNIRPFQRNIMMRNDS